MVQIWYTHFHVSLCNFDTHSALASRVHRPRRIYICMNAYVNAHTVDESYINHKYLGVMVHVSRSHSASSQKDVCIYECILIERTPPPRGSFLFTVFPHHEPGGRGPPFKHLVQILRGGPLPLGSWRGNIANRKQPRGGGVLSINMWMHTQ